MVRLETFERVVDLKVRKWREGCLRRGVWKGVFLKGWVWWGGELGLVDGFEELGTGWSVSGLVAGG